MCLFAGNHIHNEEKRECPRSVLGVCVVAAKVGRWSRGEEEKEEDTQIEKKKKKK